MGPQSMNMSWRDSDESEKGRKARQFEVAVARYATGEIRAEDLTREIRRIGFRIDLRRFAQRIGD